MGRRAKRGPWLRNPDRTARQVGSGIPSGIRLMPFLTGHFLAASPHLTDPNFLRSVVLIVQHSEEGALGLTLTRPIPKSVQDLWREVGGGPCSSERSVFLGGPVAGPLMAVHREPSLAELEILPGLFFCASRENLDALVADADRLFKIFVGHSGWGANQLDDEIEQGAWFSTPCDPSLLFDDDADLWQTVTRKVGSSILKEMLRLDDLPENPGVN
jgi:putative transcriptional regulator